MYLLKLCYKDRSSSVYKVRHLYNTLKILHFSPDYKNPEKKSKYWINLLLKKTQPLALYPTIISDVIGDILWSSCACCVVSKLWAINMLFEADVFFMYFRWLKLLWAFHHNMFLPRKLLADLAVCNSVVTFIL